MTVAVRQFRSTITALALGLVVLGLASAVAQTPPPPPPEAPQTEDAGTRVRESEREALREEIRRYSALVQAMRESLTVREGSEATAELEATVLELGDAVGAITEQLADLELGVDDNRLRLRDGRGGEVTLELPEELPEQLSQGLSSLTRMVMENMPDTVRIGDRETGFTFGLSGDGIRFHPLEPERPREVIEGSLLKLRDDLEVAAHEDVVGDVVAIMGDARIEGRVLGDVVVLLGDLELTETADVEGQVISIMGTLDRDDDARVGSITVISPGSRGPRGDLASITRGWISFVVFQGMFLVLLVLVALLVGLAPQARREKLMDVLSDRTGACLGLGLVALLIGHAAVLGLSAILVLTVIGIPVALLVVAGLLLMDLAAVGIGALAVGRALCSRLGLACPRVWRELILGMLVIHTPAFLASGLGAIGAPQGLVLAAVWLGSLVKLVVFCLGLGALLLSRFGAQGTRRPVGQGIDTLHHTPAS